MSTPVRVEQSGGGWSAAFRGRSGREAFELEHDALIAEIEQFTAQALFEVSDDTYESSTLIGLGESGLFGGLSDVLMRSRRYEFLVRRGARVVLGEINVYKAGEPLCIVGCGPDLPSRETLGRATRCLGVGEHCVAVQRRGPKTVAWRGAYREVIEPDPELLFPFLMFDFPIPGPPFGSPIFDGDARFVGWTACEPGEANTLSALPQDWRRYMRSLDAAPGAGVRDACEPEGEPA